MSFGANVPINSRIKAKKPCKMLNEAAKSIIYIEMSPVPKYVKRGGIKYYSKGQIRFSQTTQGQRTYFFWRAVLWSDETKI